MFHNKILLITGGTGTFGNAILSRFINMDFKEIRIFSRDEKKQHDMRVLYNNSIIKFYIGDVRDKSSIDYAMKNVDYVFHAAALKQVPSCEFFPIQATITNVLGTDNVIKSAINNRVAKLICLSTDKAAYPINAMGITKALMEKVAISHARNNLKDSTSICLTRYGNVMASRGSVIPMFVNQIINGQPLTITDPNMTRFLMTIENAVDLVLYAFDNGEQGDLFVQKAPSSTIIDLVHALLDIFNVNNEIKIIGTRHGEKLYETLCTREEMSKSVNLDGFFKIPCDNRDLNYNNYFTEGGNKITHFDDYNSHNTDRLSLNELKSLLLDTEFIKSHLTIFKKSY
jgi:UDP-N-acetylglucosamine 4,6-dehydratase